MGAQATGTVTGQVRDAATQRPLASVQVYLPATGVGSLTTLAGRYLLMNVPAGEVTLRVELIGYGTVTRAVTVPAGQTTVADFDLRQTTMELDQLVVTGVGQATEKRKLGNTIASIDLTPLQTAPVTSF